MLDLGEVVLVCACAGSGKGCFACTCPYSKLGDPVQAGSCAGGGTFRDGAATAAWAVARQAAGTTFRAVSEAEKVRYQARPVVVS